MSISDMNKQAYQKLGKAPYKTVLVYLVVSIAAIIIDNVYALFGHGVRSASMSLMFLYPLLGGALVFFLFAKIAPGFVAGKSYRIGNNLYNSGIAVLATGSFFKGILDIAGTASKYTGMFTAFGWSFTAMGIIFLIASSIRNREC